MDSRENHLPKMDKTSNFHSNCNDNENLKPVVVFGHFIFMENLILSSINLILVYLRFDSI